MRQCLVQRSQLHVMLTQAVLDRESKPDRAYSVCRLSLYAVRYCHLLTHP